jgi:chromosome segregation ATPase
MSNIKKATELAMPGIQGSVRVSLAELDKLRSDYISAVKIAQDLENKQMQVKFIIAERRGLFKATKTYNKRGELITSTLDNGHVVETDRDIHAEYRNIDHFRDVITQEETDRVKNLLDEKDRRITQLTNENHEMQTKFKELNASILEKTARVNELAKQWEEQNIRFTKNEDDIKSANETIYNLRGSLAAAAGECEYLNKELNKWKAKKSFWFWLWGNDTKI